MLFCSSAMNDVLAAGVLRGRPFGGLGILLHKKFYNHFSNVSCLLAEPNFIIVKLNDMLLVNIYLPSVKSVESRDSLINILDSIVDSCAATSFKEILCGGTIIVMLPCPVARPLSLTLDCSLFVYIALIMLIVILHRSIPLLFRIGEPFL